MLAEGLGDALDVLGDPLPELGGLLAEVDGVAIGVREQLGDRTGEIADVRAPGRIGEVIGAPDHHHPQGSVVAEAADFERLGALLGGGFGFSLRDSHYRPGILTDRFPDSNLARH